MTWRVLERLPLALLLLGCDPDGDGEKEIPDASRIDSALVDRCGFASVGLFAPAVTTQRYIVPSSTAIDGETITDGHDHFLVLPDAGATRPELFLWLSGSGFRPDDFEVMLTVAATAGYRALALSYPNQHTVDSFCTPPPAIDECDETIDASCDEAVRDEIIYGQNTPCINLMATNSIVHRLNRLLQFLHAEDATAGYDDYFTSDGGIVWEKIVVAGWSQGGGHAGIIARDHCVARALYASKGAGVIGNDDTSGNLELVPWVDYPRATPPEREFGSTHADERAMSYSPEVFHRWGILDFGDYVDIDDLASLLTSGECSHLVTTSRDPRPGCPESGALGLHSSMATDACFARDANRVPFLAHAYYYFLSVELEDADCNF
jgi:hypothetical protein